MPLWIPQGGMAIGAIVGTIAFCDALVTALLKGGASGEPTTRQDIHQPTPGSPV